MLRDLRGQKPKHFTHNPRVFHRSFRQLKPLLSAWSTETKIASSVLSTWILKGAHVWKLGSGIKVPAFICEPSRPSNHDSNHNTLLKYIWVKSYLLSPHIYILISPLLYLTKHLPSSGPSKLLSCTIAGQYYGTQTLQLKELLVHLTTLIDLEVNNCFGLSGPETSRKPQWRAWSQDVRCMYTHSCMQLLRKIRSYW